RSCSMSELLRAARMTLPLSVAFGLRGLKFYLRTGALHVASWWTMCMKPSQFFSWCTDVSLDLRNAVFVQQTLRTANSDEEHRVCVREVDMFLIWCVREDLAFREKQRDIASYTRKIRKLFQTMDTSGDGTINYEEFSKLVSDPKLNFWIGQLELEYHDLMSLFEFLDNGDGEITFSEFIEGATRLRGQAKALDIWRMETKVEVLFEEVLNILAGPGQGTRHSR
ncbi:Voltage-dependent T-type calcium channel subunit alpha-1I, partial [Durusdinium trenchii]